MNRKTEQKYFGAFSIIIIILAIITAVACLQFIKNRYVISVLPTPPHTIPPPLPSPYTSNDTLPAAKLLSVPFTPQAPTANWDELHGEACEEASAIMAYAYFNNDNNNTYDKNQDGTLDPEYVESELVKLTEWEKEHLGHYLDINSEETARMLTEAYGLNAKLQWGFTEYDIKKEITKGNLVLFPAQGQQLGNPNFRHPGPPYHMVVVRGYNSQGIVTNDPGTRKGANYTYTFDVLYAANGDWNQQEHEVDQNKKVIIIVSQNTTETITK